MATPETEDLNSPATREMREMRETQHRIQREQDRRDAVSASAETNDAVPVQAGARDQPTEMPAQHIDTPGHESELQLAPRFMPPDQGLLTPWEATRDSANSRRQAAKRRRSRAYGEHLQRSRRLFAEIT